VSGFFERAHVELCHEVRIMVANFLFGDGEEASHVDPGLLFTWLAYIATVTKADQAGDRSGDPPAAQRATPPWIWRRSIISAAAGGRVFLGADSGWMKKEFDVLGVPFQRQVSAWTSTSGC
jgi:hypothetical protein